MQGTKQRSLLRSIVFGGKLWTFVLAYLLLFTASVRADTAVQTTAPFTFNGINGCVFPAEEFMGSGGLHLVVSSNLSASGMVQSHVKMNFQGMQAVTATGKKYQVPDSETNSYELDFFDPAPFHYTWEVMAQFIRVGDSGTIFGGDDFFEHILAHATVNANGVVTVDDISNDTGCH